MASKDESTDSQPAEIDTIESYLLKLPPELRTEIFELVLSAAPKCYISELTRPQKPGLLQVNRQFRAETSLMYYALKNFTVFFKVSTFSLIQNWIDTVTTAELRSIESVTFIFDLTHEVKHNISVSAIVNFVKLLGRLYEMGLARSAVHVFYVADVPDRRLRVRLEAAQFLRWCVDIHETRDRGQQRKAAKNIA